ISNVNNSRNSVEAEIDVPNGDRPALLIFSRPYFRGYKAHIGSENLAVSSYRGLFPVIEVPPGTQGRLVLTYRPIWLTLGGSLAVLCALVMLGGCLLAKFGPHNHAGAHR
ncbi:MAG TPA: hypothetical protein VH229_07415, partial [Candidatus Udaeobacter sp.]|nr:hypothetical protein [Candidatus Udaeobacter sp.]